MPSDFAGAFAQLREILRKHAAGMQVIADTASEFTVTSPAIGPNGKPMWFGQVKLGKSAVSYHLMPLYFNPKLDAEVSDELRKRKQGKTCFNFQAPDEALFSQLEELTRTARDQWEMRGFLSPGKISMETMAKALRASGVDTDALAGERAERGKQASAKRAVARGKSRRA